MCQPSLQGKTKCFGAVIFQSSPSEGPGGLWNYTLRADAALGRNGLDVNKNSNDGQVYVWPVQHAVDSAIAASNSTASSPFPATVDSYLFTSKTQEEWKADMRITILQANINFASVVWILTLIGVVFQLVTLMAKERETEMSDLIESMMPNARRWEPQAIRLIARHLAFDITYAFSWIIVGGFLKGGYYKESNGAIPVIGLILSGLALVSFSILGAAFFKRAQLSSITVVGVVVVLSVLAQVFSNKMTAGAVGATSFLFTPMAFVNYMIASARFEHEWQAISLIKAAPTSPWNLPIIVFWIFFIIQIFGYVILAAIVERSFYGTAGSRVDREISRDRQHLETPIVLTNCTKVYKHSWLWGQVLRLFGKSTQPVVAIQNLSFSTLKGEVTVLIGANGCGKTTTLNAIAGLQALTSGHVQVDGSGGIGICPQKNVLWNPLTVRQHAKIFSNLKASSKADVGKDLNQLYKSCDLQEKINTPSRSLSGGQKRKLQLLMMLTGGSRVCCVDEASGGLDPLSRRKIWDILLAERGSRTVMLTTHFLDEAEFLADKMIIMSKGEIKAHGSVSELKSKLGNGYKILVLRGSEQTASGQVEKFDESETVSGPAEALERVKELEQQGITNYQIAGPTIEDVFMKLAAHDEAAYQGESEELHASLSRDASVSEKRDSPSVVRKRVGAMRQIVILLQKRWTLFQRNPAPLLQALLFPFIAAGLISMLIRTYTNAGCGLDDRFSDADISQLSEKFDPQLLFGPQSAISSSDISLVTSAFAENIAGGNDSIDISKAVHLVSTFQQFQDFTQSNYSTIVPGGIWAGDANSPPTFNVRSDIARVGTLAIFSGVYLQNILDMILSGVRIATQYKIFDISWPSATGDLLQFCFYFGLVMATFPAFFSLYPCQERVRGVRAMEFCNGVRPFPLWTAYTLFDWANTVISTVIITIIFAAARGDAWYGIGYFFLVLLLYGLAAVLLRYVLWI